MATTPKLNHRTDGAVAASSQPYDQVPLVALADASGNPITAGPTTGTTSSPASVTTTVATVLASNASRKGATIYNESGAIAYIKLGSAATTTDYTLQVIIGAYYAVPFGYTGIITGITSSGTAVLRVTELT